MKPNHPWNKSARVSVILREAKKAARLRDLRAAMAEQYQDPVHRAAMHERSRLNRVKRRAEDQLT